jgi:hypothetical protein
MFYIPAVPFLGWGLLFGIYFVFTLLKQINLYRNGEIRNAEIVAFMPVPGISLFNQKVKVLYRYKIAGNNTVEGESVTTNRSIKALKKPGDFIKIFVLPHDEFTTCLLDEEDAKRNKWQLD